MEPPSFSENPGTSPILKVGVSAESNDCFTSDASMTKRNTFLLLFLIRLLIVWSLHSVSDASFCETHPSVSEGKIPLKSRQSPKQGVFPGSDS